MTCRVLRCARGLPRAQLVYALAAVRETTARPAMAARQPSRRAAATAAAEAAAVAEMAAAAEGGGSGGGGGGEAKRLWSKHRASLALVTRVKPSQAAPIEALTTPRLAKLREQRTVHDLFAGIDNNPDHSMEEEHPKTQSSALLAEFSLPEERGLAQLELSPGFAPLRRVARRGKSSAQAEARRAAGRLAHCNINHDALVPRQRPPDAGPERAAAPRRVCRKQATEPASSDCAPARRHHRWHWERTGGTAAGTS